MNLDIVKNKLIPEIQSFRPDLIIISAGFDAHEDDPLAQMRVSSDCYGKMTSLILKTAKEVCNGRLMSMLEGGYNLEALSHCVTEHLKVLKDDTWTVFVSPLLEKLTVCGLNSNCIPPP